MNNIYKELIYLLYCAVNDITPDTARVQAMDLEQLYRLAKLHSMRAAVNISLSRAGIADKAFHQAYKKAVRKNIMLDMERTAIFDRFEQQGIWYMPLKGSILKELYPENGMREMADNDVLYDSTRQAEVKEIMLSMGYIAEKVGKTHHDVYMKPPVLNFELHTLLFGYANREFYEYYQNPKRIMLPDEGWKYGFHFSDEDFYLYMTAHEYKHFSGGGTGIRSLLDCYVYMKHKGDTLNWGYISEQCNQLGIADYEQSRRELAVKVFSSNKLSELTAVETDLLEKYLNYGTYGTFAHSTENRIKQYSSRSAFIRERLFPDLEFMKQYYPFFYKHKILLPIGYIWRLFKGVFINQKKIKAEVKALRKYDNKQV